MEYTNKRKETRSLESRMEELKREEECKKCKEKRAEVRAADKGEKMNTAEKVISQRKSKDVNLIIFNMRKPKVLQVSNIIF